MRYFFIETTPRPDDTITITGADKHHIRRVLRLGPGDMIGLLDGNGYEFPAQIVSVSNQGVEVRVKDRIPATMNESPVDITVAQGFLKEKKMDDLVRHLTELGISRWLPFMAARSVPKPGKSQIARREDRWKTISAQSIKQCRRGRTMEIGKTLGFDDMLAASTGYDARIAFWENRAEQTLHPPAAPVQRVFVIIGPEGGLTDEEIDRATACGFTPAGLGPRILRAETATIAACTLVQYLYGDMGKNP